MKLYHNPMSSCSQKVRLVLAEKNLPYESVVIDLQKGTQFSEEYLQLNPNAVVPTLTDKGSTLIESTLINEYLDEEYPEHRLSPDAPEQRYLMRLFCRMLDDLVHPACAVMTYAIAARPGLLARPASEREALIANIPDPIRRASRKTVIEHGTDCTLFKTSLSTYLNMMDRAEVLLARQPFINGDQVSLADFALLPYVLRLEQLAMDRAIATRVHLSQWFSAMKARKSFTSAIHDLLPEPAVAAFKAAGEAALEDLDID
ncbi:MAG: glutathione S-transferase family protein [Pseudomonadales bacterium]